MNYINKQLTTDEKVIFSTNVNKISFLYPVLLIVIGIIILGYEFGLGLITIAVGVIMFFNVFVKNMFSEFAITSNRVMQKTGWLSVKSIDVKLQKIEGVFMEQNIIEKIFKTGKVIIIGTGGTKFVFKEIDNPFDFKKNVDNLIMNIKTNV